MSGPGARARGGGQAHEEAASHSLPPSLCASCLQTRPQETECIRGWGGEAWPGSGERESHLLLSPSAGPAPCHRARCTVQRIWMQKRQGSLQTSACAGGRELRGPTVQGGRHRAVLSASVSSFRFPPVVRRWTALGGAPRDQGPQPTFPECPLTYCSLAFLVFCVSFSIKR